MYAWMKEENWRVQSLSFSWNPIKNKGIADAQVGLEIYLFA